MFCYDVHFALQCSNEFGAGAEAALAADWITASRPLWGGCASSRLDQGFLGHVFLVNYDSWFKLNDFQLFYDLEAMIQLTARAASPAWI